MIDFRYHLVSIIAVFLALAVGIVVGTTTLNGYVLDNLRAANAKVIHDKRGLESNVKGLRNQVARRDQFATTVAAEVVSGQLDGQRVVVVTTPGVSEDVVKQLSTLVTQAGASLTGRVRLRGDLLDPTKSAVVDDVAAGVAPAGLDLPEGAATDRAVLELAAALVASPGGQSISADAATKVLAGFAGADLIDVDQPAGTKSGSAVAPATLALLVTGGADGRDLDDTGKQRQQVVMNLVRAMDLRGSGALVAGPESAAEKGGLIEAVRANGDLSDRVSTVDTVDSPYGGVSAVLALHEQAAGRSGRYGEGPGSQAAAPDLSSQ
jgi:hypothetical protein